MYIEKITGREFFVDHFYSSSKHSSLKYFDTIFLNWKKIPRTLNTVLQCSPLDTKWKQCWGKPIIHQILCENYYMKVQDWSTLEKKNIKFKGCFQRYEYTSLIRNAFIKKLTFNETILNKYTNISNSFFIHVRGGDYIRHPLHFVDLRRYYNECILKHPNETFVIFTNDAKYARKLFPTFQIIKESEIDTLFLMSKAKGCICANSTFSWWGAYLNLNRPIYLPSKWFSDPKIDATGYFFEGSTVIQL